MSKLLTNTTSLQEILNTVNALPDASTGVELPALNNEGSASDLLSGKQLINSEGNVVTGSVATFDGSYECSGDSTGGSGSGSGAPTIADFTHTEEVGDEPGMYNYTLSSSSLQSSTRYVITIFTRNTGAHSEVWKTFYRYSLSDSFIACNGSHGYVSNGIRLTLDEDTVTIAGASIMNSAFSNFWFIAT